MEQAVDPSGVATTYEYDGSGNRTSVTEGNQPTQVTTYGLDGLPEQESDGTQTTVYGHDAVGDLTKIDAPGTNEDRSFAYDTWGRTTQACEQASLAGCTEPIGYSYDALSRTTTRTQAGVSTELSYRGTTEDLVATTSGQDRLLIAQGPYGPLAQGVAGQASFYLKDLHSDVVGLYGATSGTRSFDPWGEPMGSTGSLADDPVSGEPADAPLGLQSDWTDPSTGQVDMGTRFYEPTMGRFATQDVLFGDTANPNSLNQYVYGADSPVTMSDPTGMLSCVICNRPPRPDPDPDPCHATDTCAGGNGTTDGEGGWRPWRSS